MDLGTITSVAQTLFAALQCRELKEICSILGYKSELDKLEKTVNTVKAVLLDAETKGVEELSHQAQLYIEELKDAVYDADDLLDEFVTLAERKHKKLLTEGAGKMREKANRFFSRIRDLPIAYRMSQGVKDIRHKLNSIADNHDKFGFKLDSKPIRMRREETCSYVYAQDIIGRDIDKEKIVGMLLDPTVRRDVSFLTIVGIGGLGKTTLAQLVYNDVRITKEFHRRLWVCVGDEDPNHLNVKVVLTKILESITDKKHDDSTLDLLQRKVRKHLAENKYLLILDDVWNENRDDWRELESFLNGGPSGSWVVLTTRSSNTAGIVGDGSSYDLKGLSDDHSWKLFEMVAFKEDWPLDLVQIGQKIVKKCANVPLAIRVVGSLLYGQDKNKWLSFEKNGLAEVSPKKNDILPVLKFSYHHLDSPLKSCFSYCALFPKDFEINKEMLISLWISQGYILPLEKEQSIEDASSEYFSILLRRCFFQDVKKNRYDEIISFKLHDLMHDVAQEVTKKEVCTVDYFTRDLDKKIRHLSVSKSTTTEGSWTKHTVRTLIYLCQEKNGFPLGMLLKNWMCLRALDLSRSYIEVLPDEIGGLLHLRYLDLSSNYGLKLLPKSFTKLHNLETLNLKHCKCLKELPNDFGKLVKLRCLDIKGCCSMTNMPASMGKLSCLHKLTMFVADLSNPTCGDQLEALEVLTKIKGHLSITIYAFKNAAVKNRKNSKGGYLMNKEHLKEIVFTFLGEDYEEAFMEEMQPHPNCQILNFVFYMGGRMPSWGRGDKLASSLPNLVEIKIYGCVRFQYLPSMGKLRYLRRLKLEICGLLEFVEENGNSRGVKNGSAEESLFFPSLEELELLSLEKLKGWWREEGEGDSNNNSLPLHPLPCFPRLLKLKIVDCPNLTSIPSLPNVEELVLRSFNGRLRVTSMDEEGGRVWAPTCDPHPSPNSVNSKLRQIETGSVRYLKQGLPLDALQSLTTLLIDYDKNVERLQEVEEVWRICCSSLQNLVIVGCTKLTSVVRGGLEHLTALESLLIYSCPNLTLTEKGEGNDISGDDPGLPSSSPFLPLSQSLNFMHLYDLPKLVNLPEEMRHLTSLRFLFISRCKALQSLPEWMPHLNSLTCLGIDGCSEELERRCSPSPPGQDWPNIQHIPSLWFKQDNGLLSNSDSPIVTSYATRCLGDP